MTQVEKAFLVALVVIAPHVSLMTALVLSGCMLVFACWLLVRANRAEDRRRIERARDEVRQKARSAL